MKCQIPTIFLLVLHVHTILVNAQQYANYKCSVNNTHTAIELYVFKDIETIEKVYAEGLEATCSATGTGTLADPFTIVVQLDPTGQVVTANQADCGVSEEPVGSRNYVMRALTQSLPGAFKASDRRYTIKCNPTDQVTQTAQSGVVRLAQQSAFNNGVSTEITELVVINVIDFMAGQILTTANFGQMVRLQVILSPVQSGATGVRVTSCAAKGGTLVGAPELSLIDDGCGDNSTAIFQETAGFETNGIDHTVSVSPAFQMFMFTDFQLPIIFSCAVEFCYGGDDCTRACGTAVGRRRRDTEPAVDKEVIAVVTVAASKEALENAMIAQICSDWPYVVALSSVSLVLFVTLGFVVWFYTQLRKQSAK